MARGKGRKRMCAVPVVANVISQPIVAEMRTSYLDTPCRSLRRALPDVRDGLKPVHRRILYAMKDMGLVPGSGFVRVPRWLAKCSVSTIRTAMSPSMIRWRRWRRNSHIAIRLYWVKGSFGSIDGDSPAAMRYTEAKMSRVAEHFSPISIKRPSHGIKIMTQREEPRYFLLRYRTCF